VKKVAAIFLTVLFIQIAEAQTITVTEKGSEPIRGAVVQLRTVSTGADTWLITDNNGVVEFSEEKLPAVIRIMHLTYRDYSDTLNPFTGNLEIHLIRNDVNLDEVVVTSEYAPRASGETVHPVKVISRIEIENSGSVNLEEVLEKQLNIRISNDQLLGAGMTMNGLSGQNIKFLVDGVPVTGRLDGNIDISQINLNNVQRIEVINGPMAASYGTDASGGVINLITKKQPDNKIDTGINLMYQSTGYYNADAFAGTRTGKSSLYVSGGRYFFDGWSESDTGRWQEWKPKEQIFGDIKYNYSGKKTIVGAAFNAFHETITNKGEPRISPYFAYAFDEYYKTTRLTTRINASHLINRDYTLTGIASWQGYHRTKNTYRKDLVELQESLVTGGETQDTTNINSWMVKASFNKVTPDAILNYQTGIDVNVEQADGTRFTDEVKTTGDFAVFASAEYKLNERAEVKPAIRLSKNTDYKAPVIPSIMFLYKPFYKTEIRLSYGKGFRAPGMKERYLYFVDVNHNIQGNPDLLPEYSDNFFLDIHRQNNIGKTSLTIGVNGFYNDIRNMITLAQPDVSSSLYTYVNLGKFSTHGGSFYLNGSYNGFTFNAGISYTGRYNIYSDSGSFDKYIYSPDLNAGAGYMFEKMNLHAGVYFKYNGKLPGYRLEADNTITQFENDSYKFLDAIVRKGFLKNSLYVSAGLKNILNVTSIYSGGGSGAHSGSGTELPVGTGRTAVFKLEYRFTR